MRLSKVSGADEDKLGDKLRKGCNVWRSVALLTGLPVESRTCETGVEGRIREVLGGVCGGVSGNMFKSGSLRFPCAGGPISRAQLTEVLPEWMLEDRGRHI
jgi:hypothetical protein